MTTDTSPIEHLITQVLNEIVLQTSAATPIIPETPEEMAAQHDHQVRSLIEASVQPVLVEPLLHRMQPHRPDLDSCQQWVDDLTALDRALPSINRRLMGSDDAKQQPPTVGDLATWIFEEACPATVLESTASHIKAVLEATAEQLSDTDPERLQIWDYLSGRDFACFAKDAYLDAAATIASVAVADRYYRKLQGSDGAEMAPSHRFAHLTRPIDPIVIAWQTRAIPADPDLRDREVLNEIVLQTSAATPIIPETPEEMAAQHDHQVRSLIEASVQPVLVEPLLHRMQPHRPDLDSCQQWVDDLTALDRALPSINRRLMGSDDAKQQPPTVGDLATWIFEEACPATVLESTASHIKAVLEATAEQLSDTDPERLQIWDYLSGRDFACFAKDAYLDAAATIVSVAVADRYYLKLQGSDGAEMAPSHRFAHLTRPIDPIVIAWQTRAIPADPDLRDRGIVPGATVAVCPRQGALFPLPNMTHTVNPDPVYLPGMAPPRLPNTPSIMPIFQAKGLSPLFVRGRGNEAIDRRLLLEMLMAVPIESRGAGLVSVTLQTLTDWIWPAEESYHSRNWPRLKSAFHSINACTLPWEGIIDGRRQAVTYAPLTIARWPQRGELDGEVVYECRIPPGGEPGPLVDRVQLRHYGATDVLAWRIYLHAAHHWNRHLTYKGKLLSPTVPQVERGKGHVILDIHGQEVRDASSNPVTHWNDARAVPTGETEENPAARRHGGLEVFTPDYLLGWAYPGQLLTGAKRRAYRSRIRPIIDRMVSDKALEVQEFKTAEDVLIGWQIVRPLHMYTRR